MKLPLWQVDAFASRRFAVPYWAGELKGDRVHLTGEVAPYLEGTIEV